jgi:hypothetical protein
VLPLPPVPQIVRRQSFAPPPQRKDSQESSPLGRRNHSGGANNFLNSIRHRMSPKTSISSPGASDYDQHLSSPSTIPSSPNTNSSPVSSSIPIKSHQLQQPTSSSFFDHLSSSFSSKFSANESQQQASTKTLTTEFSIPVTAPSKKLWISDDDVAVCMCCNDSNFSMFNRRHHCRRCGRVVCKTCSQQLTMIKDRLERTCKDCHQHIQNNPTPPTNSRHEPISSSKKIEHLRP